MTVHIAKVHDVLKNEKVYGTTVLVDRLWPRGVSRDDLQPDHWFKEVAPSRELRKWFGHEVSKFSEFTQRYREELAESDSGELEELIHATSRGAVTLLYGAADREHNHAVVLREWLNETPLPK